MIFLYHLIFPDDTPETAWNAGNIIRVLQMMKQLEWLRKTHRIVSLEEYLAEPDPKGRLAAVTFDDGYKHTFSLIQPLFESESIPATIFANTSHLEDGKLLWFVYINALCFEKAFPEITAEGKIFPLSTKKECYAAWAFLIKHARQTQNASAFVEELSLHYPLPGWLVEKYIGLDKDQLRQIGDSAIFTLGGHTHSHPYMDQLDPKEQYQQVIINKQLLESISEKPVKYFAYTGGIYSNTSIEVVKQAGYHGALAIDPLKLGNDPIYEIPRVDIYSPSLSKLKLKSSGYLKPLLLIRKLVGWVNG